MCVCVLYHEYDFNNNNNATGLYEVSVYILYVLQLLIKFGFNVCPSLNTKVSVAVGMQTGIL